jgi:hypothetical protein
LEHEADGTPFRLLGVGVSAIDSADAADPADLVDGRAALSSSPCATDNEATNSRPKDNNAARIAKT